MASLHPGDTVEAGPVPVALIVRAITYDGRQTGDGDLGNHALRIGEGFGGRDIGAVRLGGESHRCGVNRAVRIIEPGFVHQGGPEDVDRVDHQVLAGGVGVGGGAVGDGGPGEEAARLGGGDAVVFELAPQAELLAEGLIDADDLLAAVEDILPVEAICGNAGGGKGQLAVDVLDVFHRNGVEQGDRDLRYRGGAG